MANWGGRRLNAGRKRNLTLAHGRLTEDERRQKRAARQKAEAAAVEEFDAPETLTPDERAVWERQAPHAFKARTLVPATAVAFARYCRVVVLEGNEAKSSGVGGPNHRGLLRQLNTYEQQFRLAPSGGPLLGETPAEEPKPNKDDEAFFGRP